MKPHHLIIRAAEICDADEHDVELTYDVRDPEHEDAGMLHVGISVRSSFTYGRGRSHKGIMIYGGGLSEVLALDALREDFEEERRRYEERQREREAKKKGRSRPRATVAR